ncbi:hypothetical protein H072_8073 [Dactylellina haptotyla CBS 200.50]|uniref:BTB domain-containing protein n=1 Tax=Dactylellina haptotyla (strain CBS 200.50) TaxID=1284197 RepID=S8BGA3_DACHA|nr:hypothetical protein H072_8073 [Dactylellina haptotyla CBS 200.50]
MSEPSIYIDLPPKSDIMEEAEENNEAMEDIAEEVPEEPTPAPLSFLDHLQSTIITLSVGESPATTIACHQSLLQKSPWFVNHFGASTTPTLVALPSDNLDAVGCFIQYLYTGDYFPRIIKQKGEEILEKDPSQSDPDDGDHLLKHARVYTLAEKFGMKELKIMAHKKIHRINSSARGEIQYARYVYANTRREDKTIRGPVAAFWAARAYILRHESEEEFRKLILEFPQFGYDVITLLLDQKEKEPTAPSTGGRKRPRFSLA